MAGQKPSCIYDPTTNARFSRLAFDPAAERLCVPAAVRVKALLRPAMAGHLHAPFGEGEKAQTENKMARDDSKAACVHILRFSRFLHSRRVALRRSIIQCPTGVVSLPCQLNACMHIVRRPRSRVEKALNSKCAITVTQTAYFSFGYSNLIPMHTILLSFFCASPAPAALFLALRARRNASADGCWPVIYEQKITRPIA